MQFGVDNRMKLYEIILPGFDGSTDETDHLILWIIDNECLSVSVIDYLDKHGIKWDYLPNEFLDIAGETVFDYDLRMDDQTNKLFSRLEETTC
jgi:hypothetical protein